MLTSACLLVANVLLLCVPAVGLVGRCFLGSYLLHSLWRQEEGGTSRAGSTSSSTLSRAACVKAAGSCKLFGSAAGATAGAGSGVDGSSAVSQLQLLLLSMAAGAWYLGQCDAKVVSVAAGRCSTDEKFQLQRQARGSRWAVRTAAGCAELAFGGGSVAPAWSGFK